MRALRFLQRACPTYQLLAMTRWSRGRIILIKQVLEAANHAQHAAASGSLLTCLNCQKKTTVRAASNRTPGPIRPKNCRTRGWSAQ